MVYWMFIEWLASKLPTWTSWLMVTCYNQLYYPKRQLTECPRPYNRLGVWTIKMWIVRLKSAWRTEQRLLDLLHRASWILVVMSTHHQQSSMLSILKAYFSQPPVLLESSLTWSTSLSSQESSTRAVSSASFASLQSSTPESSFLAFFTTFTSSDNCAAHNMDEISSMNSTNKPYPK